MPSPRSLRRLWLVLSLHRTRSMLIVTWRYRILVGVVAVAYALGAMVFGGMLYFPVHPLTTGWFLYVLPSGPGPSWEYPVMIAGGPNFQLVLPLVSGILVTLSAAGVGLGMGLAVLLTSRVIGRRRGGLLRPTALASAAGLTPAMVALVTLGACCSSTAAATAGISLAAQLSGGTVGAALAQGWYLAIAQTLVIYVALIGQEQLLSFYRLLLGSTSDRPDHPSAPAYSPVLRG